VIGKTFTGETISQITFTVSMPTDEGFVGRECNRHGCNRYFRVHADCIRDHMYCPYCRALFPNDQLHTKAQVRHIECAVKEKATEYVSGKLDKMLVDLNRQVRGNSIVNLDFKPSRYRAKKVFPTYREHKVDSELLCPECSFQFQVFGIFGFCPGCGTENMLVYDANLTIIRHEIDKSDNPRRALRHAYGDLVSTFQVFCSRKAEKFDVDKPSFQELFPTRRFFRKSAGVDMLEAIPDDDLLALRRVFQKRHVCQHADGMVTDQYIRKIPEDKELLGQEVQLSLEEFEEGARVLRQVLDRLCRAFEPRI